MYDKKVRSRGGSHNERKEMATCGSVHVADWRLDVGCSDDTCYSLLVSCRAEPSRTQNHSLFRGQPHGWIWSGVCPSLSCVDSGKNLCTTVARSSCPSQSQPRDNNRSASSH